MSLGELKTRVETIEEGYEFFLAYAAQGLTDDAASKTGEQLREHLRRYDEALDGLAAAFRPHLPGGGGSASGEGAGGAPDTDGAPTADESGQAAEAALEVLRRDAEASRALVRLVAAQPTVSSQLIDNLNASIHIRALLTDVFVLGELVGV